MEVETPSPLEPVTLGELNSLLLCIDESSLSLYQPQYTADRKLTNGPDQGVYIKNANFSINTTKIGVPNPLSWPPDNSQPPPNPLIWGKSRCNRKSVDVGYNPPKHPVGAFYGQCDGFNAVVLSVVTAQNGPLQEGRVVERFGFTGIFGHAFMVVDRDSSSDLQDPHTWGAKCITIDVWYALQTDTPVVKWPARRGEDDERFLIYLNSIKEKLEGNKFKVDDKWTTRKERHIIPLGVKSKWDKK